MERSGHTVATILALITASGCFTDGGPGEDTTVSTSAGASTTSASASATTSATTITTSTASTTTATMTTAATATTDLSAGSSGSTSPGSSSAGATGSTADCPEELCDGVDNDCDGLVDEYSAENTEECDNCTLLESDGSTYWLCKDNRTWEEALAICDGRGAELVTTETQSETELLLDEGPPDPIFFWIGLNDLQDEGQFRWPGGMTPADYDYANWADGQPIDSPDFNCVLLDNEIAGRWRAAPCNNQKSGYVCEAKL